MGPHRNGPTSPHLSAVLSVVSPVLSVVVQSTIHCIKVCFATVAIVRIYDTQLFRRALKTFRENQADHKKGASDNFKKETQRDNTFLMLLQLQCP